VRTTIELSASHRAKLLRLAAERGEKGFSRLIAEAIEGYLANRAASDGPADAQRLRGVPSEPDARDLEERVRTIREGWR
jgi:hypothetical protein